MGIPTNDMSLMLTPSVHGTPASGEWTLGNGTTVIMPYGYAGDRIGIYTMTETAVAILPGSGQSILWQGEQAQEGTELESFTLPIYAWVQWTYSAALTAWVATATSNVGPAVDFGPPVALTVGGDSVEGTGDLAARAEHEHALPPFGTTAGTFAAGDDPRMSDARVPTPHAPTHGSGGEDPISIQGLPGVAAQAQSVGVAKAGALIGTRPRINLIDGANVSITVTDNVGDDRVDVSIAASGGGGGGTGDVMGPPAATDGRVAVYDGATGKLIKNGTKLEADLVTGPASAAASRVPSFVGTTGKVLQDSGIIAGNVVTNTGTAASGGRLASFTNSTGKVIQDSGVLAADVAITRGTALMVSGNDFTASYNTVYLVDTTTRAVMATMPAGQNKRTVWFKRSGPNDLVINAASGGSIDGAPSLTLTQDRESAELVANGALWYRL